MKRALLSLAAASCWLAPIGAQACDITFGGASPSTVSVTYDPFSALTTSATFSVSASRGSQTNGNNAALKFDGRFRDSNNTGTLQLGASGLIYSILSGATTVSVPSNSATSPFSPTGSKFTPSPNTTANGAFTWTQSGLQLSLATGQEAIAGTYTENLTFDYQCYNQNNATTPANFGSPGSLPVQVIVPKLISVNVAGAGSSGTIDFQAFGTLARTLNVQVRSTSGYTLAISSQNSGVMTLSGANATVSALANARIPYTLTFNGTAVSAAGAAVQFSRTSVAGSSLPLVATASAPSANRAGSYTDTLTLTFTAN